MGRILITGGAGKVAMLLRPRLARPHRTLRLFDLREPAPLEPPRGQAHLPRGDGDPARGDEDLARGDGDLARGDEDLARGDGDPARDQRDLPLDDGDLANGEEVVIGSVDDLDAVTDACKDVDAVLHLGGLSKEATAEDALRFNTYGTYCVLEGARRAGVSRVILASSNHAVGFTHLDDVPPGGLPADIPARPDTMYGWSKVAAEAAGRLYADRFGMDVLCLRIGMWFGVPPDIRGLASWLSPGDGVRLVEAALAVPNPGFRLVWGVSRNTRRWCSLAGGEAIGYFPQDDAEDHLAELVARYGEPDDNDLASRRIGGLWCDIPLGVPPQPR